LKKNIFLKDCFVVFEELLAKEYDLRVHYAKKFRFILIDEFQDTSTLQMDWLKLMMDKDETAKTIRNCYMAVVCFCVLNSQFNGKRAFVFVVE